MVILKSDHGLHMGSETGDFSGHIEHAHPWLEVLFPRQYLSKRTSTRTGTSKDADHSGRRKGANKDQSVTSTPLAVNQQRLVTWYDMYVTLAGLMKKETGGNGEGAGEGDSRASASESAYSSHAIPWAVDLVDTLVSPARMCRDARIPYDYCLCENEFSRDRDRPSSRNAPLVADTLQHRGYFYAPKIGICDFRQPHGRTLDTCWQEDLL